MATLHPCFRALAYLWAAPATLLGAVAIPLALVAGGSVRLVDGVLEVQGGLVRRFLNGGLPVIGRGAAMTLGHIVVGQDQRCLDYSRSHERVHVRQYERWGPLMIPLYLGASAVAFLRGRHPYLDNPFEREAYRKAEVLNDER